MTPQEHFFMLIMYARQSAKFNILYEVLKSQDLIADGDLQAYRALFSEEKPEEMADWVSKAWATYQSTAASLGIITGLESGPPRPTKA
jgi:hypothetical protein